MYTHANADTHSHVHTHTRTHHLHTPGRTHTYDRLFLCPSSPRSDTCNTCDRYKERINAESDPAEKTRLEGERALHHLKAERAHQQLREDVAHCKSKPEDEDMLTFDLQQSLPTPMLSTNIAFYKRKLWTYNLGVHDCKTDKGHMYVWHEALASRGSCEIGSCLLKHLSTVPTSATHLTLFSDSCGGQNRNIHMVSLWLHIVQNSRFTYTSIDQKFMVPGHSFLPNDRDFGSIESHKRRLQQVYTPSDWADVIRNSRRVNPFQVTQMSQQDFLDLKELSQCIVNRKETESGAKVQWLKMRWI